MAKKRKSYRKPARKVRARKPARRTSRKAKGRSTRAPKQTIVIQMPGERLGAYPSLSAKRKVF